MVPPAVQKPLKVPGARLPAAKRFVQRSPSCIVNAKQMSDPSAASLIRGAAYHEAGHAVVASALGLVVTTVEIQDDGGGKTTTVPLPELCIERQVAVCLAGEAAETLFGAPTHSRARLLDWYEVDKLLASLDASLRLATKQSAYRLAEALLTKHKEQVVRVAEHLMVHRTATPDTCAQLVIDAPG
jgi:ATP-dependent Zn protease